MPRTERSDGAAAGNRRRLPEGTEHVVVIDETGGRAQATAPAYRVPATRLAQYDDVDLSEYVDEDEDPESVTVYFEPGDELPLPVAAAGRTVPTRIGSRASTRVGTASTVAAPRRTRVSGSGKQREVSAKWPTSRGPAWGTGTSPARVLAKR
ncbi:hypothetical protein ACFQL0_22000 [Haloplanus litoreus]|uniref:hypothetical protein n=1 Tax=Haloplanus litoreus TaxID=767515 RepID=UPI003620D197